MKCSYLSTSFTKVTCLNPELSFGATPPMNAYIYSWQLSCSSLFSFTLSIKFATILPLKHLLRVSKCVQFCLSFISSQTTNLMQLNHVTQALAWFLSDPFKCFVYIVYLHFYNCILIYLENYWSKLIQTTTFWYSSG